jgi:hypothetical protein
MVGMMNVYAVMWPQDGEGGMARKPSGWWPPKFGGQELLPGWTTPTFLVEGRLVDLQANDAGVKLFSSRMRKTVDEHKDSSDRIEWLPVRIQSGGDSYDYAILHLLDEVDVIDRKRSVLNPVTGGVIKLHVRGEAVDGHRIFTYSNATGLVVLVTEPMHESLKAFTGCAFSRIGVSFPEATA